MKDPQQCPQMWILLGILYALSKRLKLKMDTTNKPKYNTFCEFFQKIRLTIAILQTRHYLTIGDDGGKNSSATLACC
jgi:hypothetical protein